MARRAAECPGGLAVKGTVISETKIPLTFESHQKKEPELGDQSASSLDTLNFK